MINGPFVLGLLIFSTTLGIMYSCLTGFMALGIGLMALGFIDYLDGTLSGR